MKAAAFGVRPWSSRRSEHPLGLAWDPLLWSLLEQSFVAIGGFYTDPAHAGSAPDPVAFGALGVAKPRVLGRSGGGSAELSSLPASRDLKYLLFVSVLFYFYKIFGKESPVQLSNARGAAPCGCSDTERGVCGSILVLFLASGALGGRGSAAAFCWCFPAFPRWIRAGMRAQGLGVRHSQPPHAPVYV